MAWISDNYGFEEETDLFLQKISIHQLSPELSQVMIIGVVIAKQDVRRIISKKQPGSDRYVLNFTLRDSPNDTINAMCWGEEASVKKIALGFTIGDVVKIKNPQIIERQTELQDEKFRPSVSSQFILNISPLYSQITACDGEENEYRKLIHCPIHNTSDIISLADVVYNSQNADGLNLSMLVAIKDIKPLQSLKTKTGKEVKKLLMSVFDQTHPIFPVLTWEEETANFILKNCNRRSVLLIADIKVSYNSYMKEMAATASSTTVFIPEPDVPERRVLYQYAMKVVIPNENSGLKYSDPSKVYTLEEVSKAMAASELEADEMEGIVYAVLTSFDIDGFNTIVSLRCPGCYQLLQKTDDKCKNGTCEIGSGMKFLPPEEMYDITISLTDETGNMDRCLLGGQVAENILGINVKDYASFSAEKKTALKWKFLFERFVIHFKISQPIIGNGKLLLRIIQIQKEI